MRVVLTLPVLLLGAALVVGGHARESRASDSIGPCGSLVSAEIAAIDMPMMFNRLGAQNVNWQMFALTSDLVTTSAEKSPHEQPQRAAAIKPFSERDWRALSDGLARGQPIGGRVTLRPDLRPRPLVLRVAAGECLEVRLLNLLDVQPNPFRQHRFPQVTVDHPMDQPRRVDSGTTLTRFGPDILPNGERPRSMDIDDQIAGRRVALSVGGLELLHVTPSCSANPGEDIPVPTAKPGCALTYRFFAPTEGSFLVVNGGAPFGGEGTAGTSGTGLFGMIAVEPPNARFYRGQVTEEELRLATRCVGKNHRFAGSDQSHCRNGQVLARTQTGQPIVDYEATYPKRAPWINEGKAGRPILAMVATNGDGRRVLMHSDVNAIIVGPLKDGSFPARGTYPLETRGTGSIVQAARNPTLPNRLEPFREFASIFHDENAVAQAFPGMFEHPILGATLHGVRDAFMINYGSAGVGAEVIANRLRVGPMHDCVDCAFEEFFLSSFTVGDPALLVDTPANVGLEGLEPSESLPEAEGAVGVDNAELARLWAQDANRGTGDKLFGPKAQKVFYPHDPANVHHSYIGDFVKFRNVHTGKEQHIFHLHNHQWLYNPNDDNSNYIDAQAIGPGSGYTYEIAFGGSGNRNKSAGDAVFHCHFYPHFAQGMWYLWRIHDTFEAGTRLEVSDKGDGFHQTEYALANGTPAKGSRALPDGEVAAGTPIPAVVPLPGKAMAPMPAPVTVVANSVTVPEDDANPDVRARRPIGSLAKVTRGQGNPGYPFYIAGVEDVVGSRPPTPPLDMDNSVGGWDGGLPRHAVYGYSSKSEAKGELTRWSANKHEEAVRAKFYPEAGTDLERVAMAFHSKRSHPSTAVLPDGTVNKAEFETNGAPPTPGAPFFDPCIDDRRKPLTAKNAPWRFFGNRGLDVEGSSVFDAEHPRVYKGANIQLDVVFNKLGDHFSQQRILTLWEDVNDTLATSSGFRDEDYARTRRAPEPLVMRMNTFDCARYLHTNLVPKSYERDDYQVKTPTDVIGQHIHLPKWDLVAADGSANGWNYEDGTFSPGMVRARIKAINAWNAAHWSRVNAGRPMPKPLVPKAHYFFGVEGPYQKGDCETLWGKESASAFDREKWFLVLTDEEPAEKDLAKLLDRPGACDWLGARTTVQRWFSDPVVNRDHAHRGLGTTFTHDHLGPSTHQQVGLYATMLSEPPGAEWFHNETGARMYDRERRTCVDHALTLLTDPGAGMAGAKGPRCDGGPTSWQAVIRPSRSKWKGGGFDPHREFFLQFGDFQHAYRKEAYAGVDVRGLPRAPTSQSFRKAVSPAFRKPGRTEPGAIASSNVPPVVLESTCPGSGQEITRVRRKDDGSFERVTITMPIVRRPCPEIISADDIGTMVVNYRQEPVAARVFDPRSRSQSSGVAGDLAFAFQTREDRAWGVLNGVGGEDPSMPNSKPVYPVGVDINAGRERGDPFTPILRAFSGDLVRIKIQAGSHEHEHNMALSGAAWLQGGGGYGVAPHSGWRGAQNIGLSEQFSMALRVTDLVSGTPKHYADRLLALDASQDGLWNGAWSLLRTQGRRDPDRSGADVLVSAKDRLALFHREHRPKLIMRKDPKDLGDVCPATARDVHYHVVAGLARELLSENQGGKNGTLMYNPRDSVVRLCDADNCLGAGVSADMPTSDVKARTQRGPLHDPTAILLVLGSDLDATTGRLRTAAPVEPLVLRAAAGDCINITLENRLPVSGTMPDRAGHTTLGMLITKREGTGNEAYESFNNNDISPSRFVGLTPQMLAYDVHTDDGQVIGLNNPSVAGPGQTIQYQWFAGNLSPDDMAPLDPTSFPTPQQAATRVERGRLQGADTFGKRPSGSGPADIARSASSPSGTSSGNAGGGSDAYRGSADSDDKNSLATRASDDARGSRSDAKARRRTYYDALFVYAGGNSDKAFDKTEPKGSELVGVQRNVPDAGGQGGNARAEVSSRDAETSKGSVRISRRFREDVPPVLRLTPQGVADRVAEWVDRVMPVSDDALLRTTSLHPIDWKVPENCETPGSVTSDESSVSLERCDTNFVQIRDKLPKTFVRLTDAGNDSAAERRQCRRRNMVRDVAVSILCHKRYAEFFVVPCGPSGIEGSAGTVDADCPQIVLSTDPGVAQPRGAKDGAARRRFGGRRSAMLMRARAMNLQEVPKEQPESAGSDLRLSHFSEGDTSDFCSRTDRWDEIELRKPENLDILVGCRIGPLLRAPGGRHRVPAMPLSAETTSLVTPDFSASEESFGPIEFGATGLAPPDRIKQGQKGALGAMIVLPKRSKWVMNGRSLDRQKVTSSLDEIVTRETRTSARVTYPSQTGDGAQRFEDLVLVVQKGLNLRYGNDEPVGPLAPERRNGGDEVVPEDAHDAGQMAINYGTEPMWFRFGIDPSAPFGNGGSASSAWSGEGFGGLKNTHLAFSDRCCGGAQDVGRPATPVFKVPLREEARVRIVMPAGVGRGTTLMIGGHGWQRDPYLAEHTQSVLGWGRINRPVISTKPYGDPSERLGRNAIGMWMGSQDSITPQAHFDVRLDSAGGCFAPPSTYLFRDVGGFGLTQGLWGLIDVVGPSQGALSWRCTHHGAKR